MKELNQAIMGYLKPKDKKDTIVVVSGYFTVLHIGHLRMFKAAKELGDKLIVIVNNDEQLKAKKGKVIVSALDRAELIRGFSCVDSVYIAVDKDETVCQTLEELSSLGLSIFANGGDRTSDNVPEQETCAKLGIVMLYGIGGDKVDSSTRILEETNGSSSL